MNTQLEEYYLKFPEPYQGCLFALKQIIVSVSGNITPERKYQVPFFCYKGMNLAFLWMNRKKLIIGFVTDKRIIRPISGTRMKDKLEMIQIDPNADLPKDMIVSKLQELIGKYEHFLSR